MPSPRKTRGWLEAPGGPAVGVWALALISAAAVCGCSDSSGPSKTSGVPTTLAAVEGIGLQAPGGTVLPEGPTVLVSDRRGDPVVGVSVTFTVLEGGGAAAVPSRETDGRGRARVPWILGRVPGSAQRLEARVGSLHVEFQATATQKVPGQSYYGRRGYIEYIPGDMPIVLSAPHGGDLTPAEIPDRTWGTVGQDRNTLDLALKIQEAVKTRTGAYPHIVLSRLHRRKLDPNREIVEASQGNQESERAWWEFQTFLEEATQTVEEAHGAGLYIDLHGHGHDIQRLELGYLLSSGDLESPDEVLSGEAFVNKSSFRALGLQAGVDFADLIRGPESLGSLFEALGVPAVPSRAQPDPGGNPFFSGGYNTARHGARDGGSVNGVQIECNYTGIRDTDENRQQFAEDLAEVLESFFTAFFGQDLAEAPGLRRSGALREFPFEMAEKARSLQHTSGYSWR